MSNNALIIAYASEGGNAQLLAEDFSKRCTPFGINTSLVCLNDLSQQGFAKSRLVCFVSTTGNGEFPLNGRNFYSQQESYLEYLNTINYALFALGSHSYTNFCGAGKKLNELFSQNQAQTLVEPMYADESFHSLYETWALALLSELSGLSEPELREQMQDFARKPKATYTLAQKVKLTSDDAIQDTYHLVFGAKEKGFEYKPGDVVSINPPNSASRVEALISEITAISGLDKDSLIKLEDTEVSLFDYLSHHVEISKIHVDVIKATGAVLNNWDLLTAASNEEKANALLAKHDVLSWLKAYPVSEDKMQQWLLGLAPKSPRFYSVASDTDKSQLHLCVGLSKQAFNEEGREQLGLGSGYLCQELAENCELEFELESHPNFHLQLKKPMVWVATGTGIAPFIGFLAKLAQVFPSERPKVTLYFGVRNPEQDYLYKSFLENCVEEGLIELKMAFSRVQNNTYVQNLMQEDLETIATDLAAEGHVYVCGGPAMYDEVENVLQHAVLSACTDIEEAKQKWLQFSSNCLHKDVY